MAASIHLFGYCYNRDLALTKLQLVQESLSETKDSYTFYILNCIPDYSVLWPLFPFELYFVTGEQE